jgi:hypothetical protein
MRANPPRLFIDTSTGNVRDYQHYPLASVPAVAAFVHKYYRPIGTVDGVTIYRIVRAPT